MKTKVLADWIKAEAEKFSSYRQLARSLGTSQTTVNALRDEQRKSISDDLLRAIALRKRESVADTAKWLDIEPPAGFDLPLRLNQIEQQMRALEQKVEYTYQRLAEQDEVFNSDVLNTYLLERGVNLRRRGDQERMREQVAEMEGAGAGLFERSLLGILGITPIDFADLPAVAELLKRLAGDPWTAAEVVRVINDSRVES